MIEDTYESFVPRVKERDGYRCVKCGAEKWAERNGQRWCALSVVRRNPATPDSMWNLETVCRRHVPDWE